MKTSCRLFIVEGPDGAGKSTLVRALARETGADAVHHGPYRHVSDGLERLYAESVLPAVLGQADVVLDRSWLSEPIYGRVFRKGADRLGTAAVRQLERLALRARTVVIRALPPKEVVIENFVRRKRKCVEAEMLDHVIQAEKVYDLYHDDFRTALPVYHYDYTATTKDEIMEQLLDAPAGFFSSPHPLAWASAGSLDAPVALVGDTFTGHKNRDVLYRWPFSTFGGGPAKWLALRLERAGIPESALFWVNADALTPEITGWLAASEKKIISLGGTAESVLKSSHLVPAFVAPHPNACSRFKALDPEDYELILWLKEYVI